MRAVGDKQRETIRPEFDRSISIDFQGAKITSDTGFLLIREMDQRFDILGGAESMIDAIDSMIRRLVKVGAKVVYHARKRHVHVASAFTLSGYYRILFA